MKKFTLFCFLIITIHAQHKEDIVYETEQLKIKKISEHSFVHISYIKTETWGNVASNGLILIRNKEAIVADTPVDNESSAELIRWIQDTKKTKINAVIVGHFHMDALGGLEAFHRNKIPSYGHHSTKDLAIKHNKIPPIHGIIKSKEFKLSNQIVIAEYFGEGHTRDNIIVYYPDEELIHGGCLIKSLKAGKGNLEDANVEAWSTTVKKIKDKYSNLKIVIPGHGREGDTALLDKTIGMFKGI